MDPKNLFSELYVAYGEGNGHMFISCLSQQWNPDTELILKKRSTNTIIYCGNFLKCDFRIFNHCKWIGAWNTQLSRFG